MNTIFRPLTLLGQLQPSRRLPVLVLALTILLVVGGLPLVFSGWAGATAAASANEGLARLCPVPDWKSAFFVSAAVWRSVEGEDQRAVELSELGIRTARSEASQLEASRAWVLYVRKAQGLGPAVDAFHYVFRCIPSSRSDAALRARYIWTLTLAGKDDAVQHEFRVLSASRDVMTSPHAVDAVAAMSLVIRRQQGRQAQERFLHSVQVGWPNTPAAGKASELLGQLQR